MDNEQYIHLDQKIDDIRKDVSSLRQEVNEATTVHIKTEASIKELSRCISSLSVKVSESYNSHNNCPARKEYDAIKTLSKNKDKSLSRTLGLVTIITSIVMSIAAVVQVSSATSRLNSMASDILRKADKSSELKGNTDGREIERRPGGWEADN